MKNELLKIGPLTVHGYGLMIAIGVIAAYITAEYRAKKRKMDPDIIWGIAVFGLLGGFLGAKLLYCVTMFREILANPRILLNVRDGFVVYGGIIGGVLAAYLYCRKKKVRFLPYLDLAIPSVALAQGFGRIGCLLAGCCFGQETSCPIGIVFRDSAFAPNGVPLIPTQIISSVLNFLHFFLLLFYARKERAEGRVGAVYMILYSAGRFVLEFFRGDLIRGSVGALSTSQFISIFIFLFGIGFYVWCGKREKR